MYAIAKCIKIAFAFTNWNSVQLRLVFIAVYFHNFMALLLSWKKAYDTWWVHYKMSHSWYHSDEDDTKEHRFCSLFWPYIDNMHRALDRFWIIYFVWKQIQWQKYSKSIHCMDEFEDVYWVCMDTIHKGTYNSPKRTERQRRGSM